MSTVAELQNRLVILKQCVNDLEQEVSRRNDESRSMMWHEDVTKQGLTRLPQTSKERAEYRAWVRMFNAIHNSGYLNTLAACAVNTILKEGKESNGGTTDAHYRKLCQEYNSKSDGWSGFLDQCQAISKMYTTASLQQLDPITRTAELLYYNNFYQWLLTNTQHIDQLSMNLITNGISTMARHYNDYRLRLDCHVSDCCAKYGNPLTGDLAGDYGNHVTFDADECDIDDNNDDESPSTQP